MEIKIGKIKIGPGNPVFIVAELSGNHGQDYKRALKIIDAACDAGADAIKIQTYTPDTHTIQSDKKWFMLGKGTIWEGSSLYDLYKTTYTPWEWQPKLQKYVEKKGKILFSAPSDLASVQLLKKMNIPLMKVTSFELPDLEFLAEVGRTRKPVVISRGMATIDELQTAMRVLKKNGTPKIAVLHCVSAYPASPEEMNLRTIPDIAKKFKVIAGLSDHTLGITIPIAATALGASIIEKHLCLKRSDGGADAAFSLEPEEFKEMVHGVRTTEKSLGKPTYTPTKKEAKHRVFRRSIFVVSDIKKGEKFTRENVRIIRPGYGIAPKNLKQVLGKVAVRDIERGTPFSWKLIRK